MQSISSYRDALQAIWNRSGYDRGFISNPFAGDDAARLGLRRTQEVLSRAGYEQLPYEIVHVAGSKGKGSTSSMIDAMLRAADIRTGRYLSPHLHSFRERFVVNNEMITEHEFTSLTAQFIQLANEVESNQPELGRITAFELNTAMVLAWFAQQECDVAVVEVGMGGELDSTNIVDPAVSVITALDFEHTAILGSSMAEIAENKAGIIKPSRPVLTASQPAEALRVIIDTANEHDAPLSIAGRDWHAQGTYSSFTFTGFDSNYHELRSSLIGAHQLENAGLAIAAVTMLSKFASELNIDEEAIRHGLASTLVPARFERVSLASGQTIVIDGAHTPASTAALSAAMQDQFPNASAALVVGLLTDKEQRAILEPLADIDPQWIAVEPKNPRALPVADLRETIVDLGAQSEKAASVSEGIALAVQSGAEAISITGSFSTAAEARVALDLAEFVDPPIQD